MMKKTLYCAALLLLVVSAFSCKKKDDTTTTPSLSGLVIDSDNTTFMGIGTTITVKADVSNIVCSDETKFPETIGIYYVLNSGQRDTTTKDVKVSNPPYEVELNVPGTYTLYCYAYGGSDFYNASTNISFTVVDPETALSGLPELPTVKIAGSTFSLVELQGKTWMANNLYGTNSGAYYEDSEILASIFGQYYTWTEAQGACPNGWHLPSAEEFDQCVGNVAGDAMVNAQFVDKNMWTYWPEVPITNSLKFCALPVGFLDFTLEGVPEDGYKQYACFWTADENEETNLGVFRYIYEQENEIKKGLGDKETLAMSVRCVRD